MAALTNTTALSLQYFLGKPKKCFQLRESIIQFITLYLVNDIWLDCASYIARCFVFVFENKGVVEDKKSLFEQKSHIVAFEKIKSVLI